MPGLDDASGPDLSRFLAATEYHPGDDEKANRARLRRRRRPPTTASAAPASTPPAAASPAAPPTPPRAPHTRPPSSMTSASAQTDQPDAMADAAKRPRPSIGAALKARGRGIVRLVVVVGIVVAAALLLRTYVVAPYYIPSASMEPTLHGCPNCDDDHILVDKVSYRLHPPHASDIVVFQRPPAAVDVTEKVLIKRVIAVGGDTVTLRGGAVLVNGAKLNEPYLNSDCGPNPTRPLTATSSWKIPDDDIFVMGDNRCDSEDSRYFGPIPTSSVIGRAWVIIWPLKRFGSIGG